MHKALLKTSEPRYEVASIAAKTGMSITHAYERQSTDGTSDMGAVSVSVGLAPGGLLFG